MDVLMVSNECELFRDVEPSSVSCNFQYQVAESSFNV
jgi:hypothetical protein